VEAFVRPRGWRHVQVVVDDLEHTGWAFRVDTYPAMFVVGPGGRILGVKIGEVSTAWLEQVLQQAGD